MPPSSILSKGDQDCIWYGVLKNSIYDIELFIYPVWSNAWESTLISPETDQIYGFCRQNKPETVSAIIIHDLIDNYRH